MKNFNTRSLVSAAIIAAMYTVLTFVFAPISFGVVQFRISEALTILPLFTPIAIPGLTVGCLISNFIGLSMGQTQIWDLLFGTSATLLAAITTYLIGKLNKKHLDHILGPFPAVLFNGIIVGMQLTLFYSDLNINADILKIFLVNTLTVMLGEFVVCYVLGNLLMFVLKRNNLHKKIFGTKTT